MKKNWRHALHYRQHGIPRARAARCENFAEVLIVNGQVRVFPELHDLLSLCPTRATVQQLVWLQLHQLRLNPFKLSSQLLDNKLVPVSLNSQKP
jgi:hypothetical protein